MQHPSYSPLPSGETTTTTENDDMINVTNPIDALGIIQSQIAELRKQEQALKGQVLNHYADTGETRIEGDLYKATVIEAERNTVDWKKIATDLGATPQRIRANTKTTETTTIKVAARSTAARRAA